MSKLSVGIGLAVVVLIVGLMALFGSWYSVDQGEEGVILTNGAVTRTDGPGLHQKWPFVQSVETISLQSHTQTFDKMEAYSKDQQPADIRLSVSYHVIPGEGAQVYSEYTNVDTMIARLLSPRTYAIFKNVFGQYDAASAIQQRAKLNTDALIALQAGMLPQSGHQIIQIESVQVEDIKFSPDYEAAIAAKQQATVKVQEQQQLLAQEKVKAEIVATTAQGAANAMVAQANGQAQAVRLAADAEAYAIEIKGKAEATAIEVRGAALKDNSEYVSLVEAQQWNGALPTTMVPGATVPFISVR